jgi:selenocysteine lyase/cysteine desulfurase
VLVTDHEYPDMVETLLQRQRREAIVVRTVRVPAAAADRLALVARVADAITPRTRLLLVSHVSAWSGEVLPVAEVTAAARARGVAVLVDAAQSVGLLDVDFQRLGCDFLGASLHKWLGGPIASGVLLIRPEHVGRVEPLHPPSWDVAEHPTDQYEWSGAFQMPAYVSVQEAIAFQRAVGLARKRARLRYLGDHWQERVRGVPGVSLLTPRDPARSLGVASFAVDGVPSKRLAEHLRKRRGILVQDKAGRHSPFANAVRVAPQVHTTPQELDRFVAAVREVARNGVPGGVPAAR